MTVVFDAQDFLFQVKPRLHNRILSFSQRRVVPKLVWLTIGNFEANTIYGKIKAKAGESYGIAFEKMSFAPEQVKTVLITIRQLNKDPNIHGVMVQLPAELNDSDTLMVLEAIDPQKDVDCLNPLNLGRIAMNNPFFLPPTIRSILSILRNACKRYPNDLVGRRILVIGSGLVVGKPLILCLKNIGATVLWVSNTESKMGEFTKIADVVISATGQANLISGAIIKKGVVCIDVGSPKGDFDFDSCVDKARFITKVPGGVGPLTVYYLMENVVTACERLLK